MRLLKCWRFGAGFSLFLGIFWLTSVVALADSQPYYRYTVTPRDEALAYGDRDAHFSQLGSVMVKGDFNGDGKEDIAVGMPYFSSDGRISRGKVVVYFAGADFFGRFGVGHNMYASSVPSLIFLGINSQNQLGTSLAAGDINGDGVDDLIMGAPGGSYLTAYFGRSASVGQTVTRTYDYAHENADWFLQSNNEKEKFGFSLDVADLNSDGIGDVIAGAPYGGNGSRERAGRVYLLTGRRAFSSGTLQWLMGSSLSGMTLYGINADDQFGISLTHGDLDGDRHPDIIVGSYLASNGSAKPSVKQAGSVSMFLGKYVAPYLASSAFDPQRIPRIVIGGNQLFGWFGYSVAVGDLNHDGIDDLAIGSFPYLKRAPQGEITIVWGGDSLDTGSNPHYKVSKIVAPRAESLIGGSLVIADVNRDGIGDLLVGAPVGVAGSEMPRGRAYILMSFPRNVSVWDFSKIPADIELVSEQTHDWFGTSIVSGDFDNDGNEDVLVGAPNARVGSAVPGGILALSGPLTPIGEVLYTIPSPSEFVSRASFIVRLVRDLELETRNKEYLDSCAAMIEFCFFRFTSQTRFSGLQLDEPLQLYPDVKVGNPFYHAVNVATMLGVVNGFLDESDSPFHPERPISRIHALKILLTATKLLPWQEYTELQASLAGNAVASDDAGGGMGSGGAGDFVTSQKSPYRDVSAWISHMWWYPRYVNFARAAGIINDTIFFRPDAPLTQAELDEWLTHIRSFVTPY